MFRAPEAFLTRVGMNRTEDMDAALKDRIPTRVGMNRHNYATCIEFCGIPHTRGDEPGRVATAKR